jgi:hypothetical protein
MNDAMLIASLWLSAKAQRGRAGKSVVKPLPQIPLDFQALALSESPTKK